MRPRTLLGLIAVGAFLVYSFAPIAVKVYKLRTQEAALKQDVRDLVKQKMALQNELMLLREDPVYVEMIARRTFNLAKEGEIVYQFVDGKREDIDN